MNQRSSSKMKKVALLILGLNLTAQFTWAKTVEDETLEKKLIEMMADKSVQTDLKDIQNQNSFSMSDSIKKLIQFKEKATVDKCVDKTKTVIEGRYVLSMDQDGKPCRVYDLTFPNLQALINSLRPMKVPVRQVTATEYLQWIDGNSNQVQNQNTNYRRQFNSRLAARTSWVAGLKFKNKPVALPGSQLSSTDLGLPQSFTLGDLDLGGNFQFDQSTKDQIKALSVLTNLNKSTDEDDLLSAETLEALNKPENVLKKIRFNWNDLEKVYDVALEGTFLPFSGPVVLVDFKTQYKYAAEKLIRSFLASGLKQLSQLVPNPTTSALIDVAVTDLFEQVELMYDYQLAQFEQSIHNHMMNPQISSEDLANANRALNLMYGQKADLFTNYILAVAQGKPFDWMAFEKMGRSSRYANEKARDIMMSNLNSRLVLEKSCKTEFISDYFAICTRNGKKDAIYSLISERTIFTKNFGAPMVYRYSRPYEATLVRGGAWLLSIAARVWGPAISKQAAQFLSGQLKNVMRSGLVDEAFLKGSLSTALREGKGLSMENQSVLSWMFIQNLNPFLPKSIQFESKLIQANKEILGLKSIQP